MGAGFFLNEVYMSIHLIEPPLLGLKMGKMVDLREKFFFLSPVIFTSGLETATS